VLAPTERIRYVLSHAWARALTLGLQLHWAGSDGYAPIFVFILLPPAQVLEDMHSRPLCALRPALVINLDVKDSHEEAALAAPHALELCTLVSVGSENYS